ncbi:MAG: rhomboid family intramembrane serine protease [Bacilli bacterium]|nr:rhomboid family intramembrane serine protease [Bacilli bacterium]
MNRVIANIDENVMKLLHYFITVQGYNPIILHGSENEIWLENMDSDYRIVRIVSNYIHNNEQFKFDIYRTKQIVKKIKKQTISLNMNMLSIFINLGENVNLEKFTNLSNIDVINLKNIDDLINSKQVLEVFPNIKNIKDVKETGIDLFVKLTGDINKKNEKEYAETNDIFKQKKPIITVSIIVINFIIFLLMYIFGKGSNDANTLLKFGALYKPLVRNGEIHRLIITAFLHIGLIHLLVNNYSLYVIGSQLESFLGKFKFIIIYIVSALSGSLMSIIFSSNISAGASGAIFGLLGSILYFGYNYRVYLGNVLKSQIIPLIILNLLLGFSISGIDNAAHIGGMIGGLLTTIAVGLKHKTSNFERINGCIILVIYLLFLGYMGLVR